MQVASQFGGVANSWSYAGKSNTEVVLVLKRNVAIPIHGFILVFSARRSQCLPLSGDGGKIAVAGAD